MKIPLRLSKNDVNLFLSKVKTKLTNEGSEGFLFIPDRIASESGLELLHVFIKEIQGRQVYIKIKMKEIDENEIILCISFHFAERNVSKFPYG